MSNDEYAGDRERTMSDRVVKMSSKHQGKLNAVTVSLIAAMVPVMVVMWPSIDKALDRLTKADKTAEGLVRSAAISKKQWIAFAQVIGDQNGVINEVNEALIDTIDHCRESMRGDARRAMGEVLKKARRIELLGGKQAMRKFLLEIELTEDDLEESRAHIYHQHEMLAADEMVLDELEGPAMATPPMEDDDE